MMAVPFKAEAFERAVLGQIAACCGYFSGRSRERGWRPFVLRRRPSTGGHEEVLRHTEPSPIIETSVTTPYCSIDPQRSSLTSFDLNRVAGLSTLLSCLKAAGPH